MYDPTHDDFLMNNPRKLEVGTSQKYLYYAPQSACAHTVAAEGKEGVLGSSGWGNLKACFWPNDTFCAAQAHLRT